MERPDARAGSSRDDVHRVVVPREQIAHRVGELAEQISQHYLGRELTILAVLTGSLVFLADLIRRLPVRLRLHVVSASSYGAATKPGTLRVEMPADLDLAGRDVLIVDDILDTGRTLDEIVRQVAAHKPASLRCCVLLEKSHRAPAGRIEPDFRGFQIDGQFVVGYGLDIGNLYRNLPDICVLTDEAMRAVRETGKAQS